MALPATPSAGDTGHITAHGALNPFYNAFIFSSSTYIPATSVSDATAGHLMLASARAAAGGVASLDGGSHLPASQLPTVAMRTDTPSLLTALTGTTFESYNTFTPYALIAFRGGRGTQASPVALNSGDIFGALFFQGQYDTTYGHAQTGAGMRAKTTQGWSSGNNGAQLEFFTNPNNVGGTVNALVLGQDQSAAFAGALSAAGDTTLSGALTVANLATFTSGIVAANAILTDGTNNQVGNLGAIPLTASNGIVIQGVRDTGALSTAFQPLLILQARGATDGAHTISTAAQIRMETDTGYAAGSSIGRILLATTPSGSTTPTTRIIVGSDGKIAFGSTAAGAGLTIDNVGLTLTLLDATNIVAGTTTGTKIGTGTTQKLGFWNATPVGVATGWGTPTNTFARTTFDTTTVTLAQLASRVGALISDLVSYGLLHS